MKTLAERKCCVCRTSIWGRSDKRYCSVQCKNRYNQKAKKLLFIEFENWSKRLKRNMIVLEGMLGRYSAKIEVKRETLFRFGFDQFTYVTLKKEKGINKFNILQFDFVIQEDGKFLITRNRANTEVEEEFYRRWRVDFPDYTNINLWDSSFKRYENPV